MSSVQDLNDRAVARNLPDDPAREAESMTRPHLAAVERGARQEFKSASQHAELSLCAALLWGATHDPGPLRASALRDILEQGTFGSKPLGSIFEAIVGLEDEGQQAEPVAVHSAMVRRGLLVVGTEALDRVLSQCRAAPTEAALRQWAEIIREASHGRALAASAREIATAASSGNMAAAIAAVDSVNAIATAKTLDSQIVTAAQALDKGARELFDPNADRGVSTGIAAYDHLIGRLLGKQYTLAGASSGDGKTALGLTLAGNLALRNDGVLYASTEMAPDKLMLRLACSMANVSALKVIYNHQTPEEMSRVITAIGKFKNLPIELFRTKGLTEKALAAAVRFAKKKLADRGVQLRLVVVDYIQEMSLANRPARITGEKELLDISSSLSETAQDFGVHMFALAQTHPLGAKAEGDGKPNVDNLAGAKSMQRPAENVLFIHRHKVDGTYPKRGPADLVVRKARWGARGDVPVIFDGPKMQFIDDPDRPYDLAER